MNHYRIPLFNPRGIRANIHPLRCTVTVFSLTPADIDDFYPPRRGLFFRWDKRSRIDNLLFS